MMDAAPEVRLDAAALGEISVPAFRRPDGRWGVRNHVIILPVDDLSNRGCELVATTMKGALAIPHPYGRLQFGADLELHFRTLIGTGSNPNVAAVVVIGIEDGWTRRVVDGIAATGKPVRASASKAHGDHDTIMRASKAARRITCSGPASCERERLPAWPTSGCRPSAANPTRRRAAAPIRPSATRSTSCTPPATPVLRRDDASSPAASSSSPRAARRRGARAVHVHVRPLPGRDQPRHKTNDLSDSQPTRATSPAA